MTTRNLLPKKLQIIIQILLPLNRYKFVQRILYAQPRDILLSITMIVVKSLLSVNILAKPNVWRVKSLDVPRALPIGRLVGVVNELRNCKIVAQQNMRFHHQFQWNGQLLVIDVEI